VTAGDLVALAAAQALYFLAGTGITAASAALAGRASLGSRPAVSWLAGLAGTTLVVMDLAIAGVRPTRVVVVAVAVVIAAAGSLVALRRGLTIRTARFDRRPPLGPFAPVGLVCAAVTGVVLAAMLDASWDRGVANYDSWTFWVPKALILHYFGLDAGSIGNVLAPSDPIFAPALQASVFGIAGSGDTMLPSVLYVVLLIAVVLAAAALLRQIAPAALVWPALLLLVVMPEVVRRVMAPEGDLPWQYFFGLGTVVVLLWAVHRRTDLLPVGALFLAAAATTKREGLLAFVVLSVASGILVTPELRHRWRGPAACGIFVALVAAPWWVWTQMHLHTAGSANAALAIGALVVGGIGWNVARLGRWALLVGAVAVVVIGVPAVRLLRSGGETHIDQLPAALHVAAWDLFDPSNWVLASFVCLPLLAATVYFDRHGRVVPFVLFVSAGLFGVFVIRLLNFPLAWYPHPSLTPARRNMASIVLLWLFVTPFAVARLGDITQLVPRRLAVLLDRNVPFATAAVCAPALLLVFVASARGEFSVAAPSCEVPVTNPADAAFVFGHVPTNSAAHALQQQVQKVGFMGTVIAADPCGRFRVMIPHVSTHVAEQERQEAAHVGIHGTIEQTTWTG